MHPLFDVRKFKGYVLCIQYHINLNRCELRSLNGLSDAFRYFSYKRRFKPAYDVARWVRAFCKSANLARGASTRLTSPLFRLQETTKLANTQPYTHTYSTFGSSLIPQEFTSASSMECVVNTTTDCFRFSATSWKINGWVWWDAWIHALWMASRC